MLTKDVVDAIHRLTGTAEIQIEIVRAPSGMSTVRVTPTQDHGVLIGFIAYEELAAALSVPPHRVMGQVITTHVWNGRKIAPHYEVSLLIMGVAVEDAPS